LLVRRDGLCVILLAEGGEGFIGPGDGGAGGVLSGGDGDQPVRVVLGVGVSRRHIMQTESAKDGQHRNTARAASVVAAAVMATLALFEIGLAAGAPWGSAAWGGGQPVLSPGMRLASAGAAVVWSTGLLVVLRRGGYRVWSPLPDSWIGAAVWIFAAYTALMVLVNAASPSGAERAVMTPASVVLAVACALTARWGAAPSPQTTILRDDAQIRARPADLGD
jgi:hypothetical protein